MFLEEDGEYQLSLPPTYMLSGVVRDSHGTPVDSQSLLVEQGNRSVAIGVNPDGTYSIKLAAGEYRVSTRSYGGASVPPQDHGRVDLFSDTVLDIHLKPGLALTVDVIDEDGVGIDGVDVLLQGPNVFDWARTRGGDGAILDVMPGAYELFLDVPAPYLQLPPFQVRYSRTPR